MELRQLRYFRMAARELHFQRAARLLNITQPALSHQIKSLEEELDVVLLDRSRSHVELTDAGKVFLQRAERILRDIDDAVVETQKTAGREPAIIKVGTADYLNLEVLARSILAIRSKYPDITVEQVDMPTNQVFPAVKEGQIDLAVGPLPATHPALVVKKLITGKWSLVLPDDSPLAGHDIIELAQLNRQPLILFDQALNPKLYVWWLENFKTAGFKPKIVFETRQVQTALKMVQDHLALYIVASYIVQELPDNLASRPLTGFDNEISIGAVWHENNDSKSLRLLLDELRQQI